MISSTSTGSFSNALRFLRKASKLDVKSVLERNGQQGVDALSQATPIESGLAAQSWSYRVSGSGGRYEIAWTNSDIENGGFPVVIRLQYGYGTGTGGFVEGRDFINPAIRPIFDRIADEVWKAVTSA